ncbi:hypothetical protein TUM20985_40250 [Mycobacterium antarcticum]|uniref:DUF305 domain-containing protein n=1 Tax=unclassified Mycolicibacterium TaxID=2636767 RepID=UPI00238A309F|nr:MULTISPECIES: DUF305 domain-containing protein [unclassified Mycolicibacterium]BDX33478.1 hypothetical protein TUM20985_40250 [Mycolicibacterium sp. TUM20985]GLP82911.1 hypothetical protein TUM20984_43310 [Mycolicibacterium sp. TUM20984]
MRPRCIVAALLLTVATVVSSCGASVTDPHDAGVEQPVVSNAADIAFARNMIPHHQQAVVLAAMVPARTTNPDLRVMAAHIGADQHAEILTMNLLLEQWHAPADPDRGAMASHEDMAMMGMVDEPTIDRLTSLDGAAFDTLWIQSMIGHHQGAVTMANDEVAHGQNPDAVSLARQMITAQQREIAMLTHLISASQ